MYLVCTMSQNRNKNNHCDVSPTLKSHQKTNGSLFELRKSVKSENRFISFVIFNRIVMFKTRWSDI